MSFDLYKTLDSVCVEGLLWKLNNIGIPGSVFGLLRSFLKSGSIYIEIGDHKSETFRSNVKLPQSSILSPPLVINFVPEMFSGIEAENVKCGSDGKILTSRDTKVELDGQTTTALLKHLVVQQLVLERNIKKFIQVPINLIDGNILSNNIGSYTVKISESCRVLGREFETKLSFKSH